MMFVGVISSGIFVFVFLSFVLFFCMNTFSRTIYLRYAKYVFITKMESIQAVVEEVKSNCVECVNVLVWSATK